ncbi:MAG TPA: STAS domain-containing protein [Burkholderiales bacterium]|nr:STAS domain-containing protein [Burkholderiales bacterium]
MELETQPIDGGITMIRLRGRMDVRGAQEIDLKFSAVTGVNHGAFIVDMSQVDFLASIGIRTLLVSAKAVKARGGRLVLFKPTESVAGILEMARITDIIPMFHELDAARAAVTDT